MKKHIRIILFTFLLGSALWSCKEKFGSDSTSLRSAINQSSANLNTAVTTIGSSKAFSILTVNAGTLKSGSTADSVYKVYIPLEKISGVYKYKPGVKTDRWGISLIRFFNRTADNSEMIIKIPLKKVEHPWLLRQYIPSDSTLTNNFSIAVSQYHNNYNSYHDFDYKLASEISIDDAAAGNLNIDYFVSPTDGIKYASEYAFTEGYTADYKYVSGDTTVSSFSISKSGSVLYEEKRLNIKSDTGRFGREHQYILTIGNVQIVRKSGSKTAEIYVDGTLQPDAFVTVVDKADDSEASVCKKRDVQITFEDGSTATISELIGKSVDNIKTLFDSLHSVYFAAYVVDWIAYDIYYERN
jgi:hypothetical protein